MVTTLTLILVAYLVGGIPFGLIIARIFGVADIRKEGSGNIGATNVHRVAGMKAAVWVYALDIGKGIAVVLLARRFDPGVIDSDWLLVIVALTAVIGHVFSIYLKFRGGKGVNTALGGILILMPGEALAAVGVFAVVATLTRYISLGSICGVWTLPAATLFERYALHRTVADVYLYLGVVMGILVLMTHRENIRRLVAGRENRFSFSRSNNNSKAGSDA